MLTGEYLPFDLLQDNGDPICLLKGKGSGYGWTEENQDGTLGNTSRSYHNCSRCWTYHHPRDIYKYIRRSLRNACGAAAGGWGQGGKSYSELVDKEFQKEYFKNAGDNITIETYEVNMRTGQVDKVATEDLSKYYPKRISHVYA